MNKERILLTQDNSLFNEICRDLEQFKPLLNDLKLGFELLEIGSFTNTILKEIVFSGTKGIENKFNEKIDFDFEKLGIKNTLIKENILKGSETILNKFLLCVDETKKFTPATFSREKRLELKFISFGNGGFTMTNEDKENLLESKCRIYIETNDEHALYEALTKFLNAFNEFDKNLVELGLVPNHNANRFGAVAEIFLIPENGKYKVKPESIRWAINRKAFNERMSK